MVVRACLTFVVLAFMIVPGRTMDARSADKQPPLGPDFTLPDLMGKTFSLKEMRGHTLVLNFWAFWCDTWKDELPDLKDLAKEQTERDFRLVAISVDGTRLREFMDRTKGDVGFPVLLDNGSKVSVSYQVCHVPTLIILDAAGRIRFTKSGYPGNEAIRTVLRKLKSEKRSDYSRQHSYAPDTALGAIRAERGG